MGNNYVYKFLCLNFIKANYYYLLLISFLFSTFSYGQYCTVGTTSSSYWITEVNTTGGFTNISNTTGYSAGGYGDFTAQAVNQSAGLSFDFTVNTSSGTHGINIWVDWNNDFDFNDVGEDVYASGAYVTSATGTITIPGATATGNYRMRVVANWSSTNPAACGSTTYSEAEDYIITVSAPPTCYAPENLTATVTSNTSGDVSWTAPSSGTSPVGYEYVISTSNTTPTGAGTATTLTTNSFTGLTPDTTYYVFIRSNCGGSDFSNWAMTSFLTGYCTYNTTSSSYWIEDFTTTGANLNINNTTSGYSAGGYGDFTSMIVNQSAALSFDFNITMSSSTHGINIWVDWNQDFDFDDVGEQVYASGGYVTTATGTITIPGATPTGNYRMRVVSNFSSTNPTSCGSSTYTETEDYTLVVDVPPTCYWPDTLTATTTSTTSGDAVWTAPSSGTTPVGYEYVISTTNTTPTGSGTATTLTNQSFTGLTPNTTYYVFVRSNCGGGDFSYWVSDSFYTGYCISETTSSSYWIDDFSTTGGTANITNNNSGYSANGYGDFSAQSVSQNSGLSFDFNLALDSGTHGVNIWVDWNNDFDFDDTGELVYASGSYVSTATGTINIPTSTATGNYRMRVVANYSATNPSSCGTSTYTETEDYTINCLGPLPCAGAPTNIYANPITATTADIYWDESSPAPANGYQYYLSTTATPIPNGTTTPTGSVAAGTTSVTLTGLTDGVTYYVWIRNNCGGGLGEGAWEGATEFTIPSCAFGDSTGTTSLGCPSVTSGGLGLSGSDPANINCASASTCVDLEATYLQLGDTSDYLVESIAYNPPYQFDCLKNPVSVNIDDRWSSEINLPFDFCFYDNTYSSCVIGSNGLISFDTSLADSGSGYSFSDNLPSTTGALFANAIYGVYHDIDPSVGGEVGFELITLNTGCRALVAAWHDVPMFSENTLLYTGMIVLYENTNVIEVYIEEKNIDNFDSSPWNGGNAIVGIQNDDASIAHVAPGRNGLDTNWQVTNEAWRFVPNGTSITSINWYQGSGTSGPVVGTTDVINVCPTNTTTYTAEVTYTLCDGSTITETDETTVTVSGSKVWQGSISTNWQNPLNWSPIGVPTNADCVIIPDTTNDPIISPANHGDGLNLRVDADANLTIQPDGTLTVVDFIYTNPTANFTLENDASLIQVNDVANTGNINVERTANIRNTDYVFWSTPVIDFPVSSISPSTPLGFIYQWLPTTANTYGDWDYANENMIEGKGYIVRGPSTFTSTPQDYTATFVGVPQNGTITKTIERGTYTGADYAGPSTTLVTSEDDNWNLIGNPYPSALNVNSFLTANTNIEGSVRIWTHGTALSAANPDPFYNDYTYNYSPLDFIVHNGTGTLSGPATFSGYIGSGQGFFVLMNDAPTPTSSNVSFDNSMRNSAYANNDFYRTSNPSNTATTIEKHRVWLDLINNTNGITNKTLVGYVDGATNDKDRMYDAYLDLDENQHLYSLINTEKMAIQGRPTPFTDNDQVPLGVKLTNNGSYTIAISDLDGTFSDENTNVYLEDTQLQIIHNLKNSPYTFTANTGEINDRFILRYNEFALSTNQFDVDESSITIISSNQIIKVNSTQQPIKNIVVYDMLGRKIISKSNINTNSFDLENLKISNGALLVEVTLQNGYKLIKKVVL